MYTQKKIRGFCHLYIGQEAICVGTQSALTNQDDAIITAYRDHGWFYVRGGTIQEIIAEMMGKIGGCSKGKGGSMHFYHVQNNFYGGNGIVGAQVPVGVGVALRLAYDNPEKPRGICISLYGDGAANQGQIFEAMNMASLWKIPAVFACENNLFGMGTAVDRAAANVNFYQRCDYIPGIWVDGMDVLACREATRYAKEWGTSGNGPLCMEFHSYRYMGHSMSDPGTSYRTRDDVQKVKEQRDCIGKYVQRLITEGVATADELKEIEKETLKTTDAAVLEGEASKDTTLDELYTDIYAGQSYPIKGVDRTIHL